MENVDNATTSNANTKVSIVKERLKLFDPSHTENNSCEYLEQIPTLADTARNRVGNSTKRRSAKKSDASELSIHIPTAHSSGYFTSTPEIDSTSTQSVFDDTAAGEFESHESDLEICERHWDNYTGATGHSSARQITTDDEEFEKYRIYENVPSKVKNLNNETSATYKGNPSFLHNENRPWGNISKEFKEKYNNYHEDFHRRNLNKNDQGTCIMHSVNDDPLPRHIDGPPPLPPKLSYKTKLTVPAFPEGLIKPSDSPNSVTSSPRSAVYEDHFIFKNDHNTPFSTTQGHTHIDISEKPQYISQLSKEELFQNYYMIEKLRKSYKEEIEKVLKRESVEKAIRVSDQGQQLYENQFELKMKEIESEDQDLEIYRDESDDVEDEYGRCSLNSDDENYIVEAYNANDNELVISDIQIKEKVERAISTESSQSESYSPQSTNRDIPEELTNQANNLYLNLSDCISGACMTENDERKYISSFNRQASIPNGNVQIHIEVTREGEKYETRQQTLYDRNSNPRIQKIKFPFKRSPKEKKDYIVEELINTEEKYIDILRKIVEGYIKRLNSEDYDCMPKEDKNRMMKYIFGNVESIYNESLKFYEVLKACDYDHEKIAEVFIKFEHLFKLYPEYSYNKIRADRYLQKLSVRLKAIQQELGDRLDIASYLLAPIQRLGKYILLLDKINMELGKKGKSSKLINAALEIVKKEMSKGNDYVAICSIKNSPIKLADEAGSFKMRETFTILKPKKFESVVFLFEEIIVFTITTDYDEEFKYIDSIRMIDLTLINYEHEPLSFLLKNYPQCKKGNAAMFTYLLEAKSPRIKQVWSKAIEDRLWQQLYGFREQVRVEYNGHPKKTNKVMQSNAPKKSTTLPVQKKQPKQNSKRSSTFYVSMNK